MKGFYRYFQFLFFFIVFFILFSLFVAISSLKNVMMFYFFNIIGSILLTTFSFLSFYLVLYPLVNWFAYRNRLFTKKFIFNWNYTIILFFTLTFLLQINNNSKHSSFYVIKFLETFGTAVGTLLLVVVLVLELVILFYLNYVFYKDITFLLNVSKFLFFKISILFDNIFSLLNFKSTNLSSTRAIKVYSGFDSEEKASNDQTKNLDVESSRIENTIINDEEYKFLWDLKSVIRPNRKHMIDLNTNIFVEHNDQQSVTKIIQEVALDKDFVAYEQDVVLSKQLLGNRVILEGKTLVSEIKEKGILNHIHDNFNEKSTGRIYCNSTNYHIKSSVFDEREPKSSYEDKEFEKEIQKQSMILQETLKEFSIRAKLIEIIRGPVVTMYALRPDKGIKLSRITSISDNIALRLAAARVRIIAPIPGKEAVGIEIPNKKREFIMISEIINSKNFSLNFEIPFALGKDISGENVVVELSSAPHLLIAGTTGAGKSVCVNSLIASIIFARSPSEVKFIMIDPKIVELKLFNNIPHLLTPVITDVKRALEALKWCVEEMERRYTLLDYLLVRDISSYNKKIKDENLNRASLPYLVLVIDEFADLILSARKDLENLVSRLAAMARAVGIHLVLATQRPSVDVITGVIKANFPSRISFMVASAMDSRIILGTIGAEKLLGKGDMLYVNPTTPFPQRIQGGFLKEKEIYRLVEEVKKFGEPNYIDDEIFIDMDKGNFNFASDPSEEPLFEEALDIIRTTKKASASYLQRRLKIGYNRAARIIELMEEIGYIGPINGSKPREIFS